MTHAQSVPPEIPPLRPDTPEPEPIPTRPQVPTVTVPLEADDVRTGLHDQRRVLVTGDLDEATVTALAAELMLLDGRSSEPVELVVNSGGGPVDAVTALLDVVELARAPVHTRCIGRAAGTAAAVLACGTGERSASPSARISLRVGAHHRVDGPAHEIARTAAELTAVRRRLAERLAGVTRMAADDLVAAFDDGPWWDAPEARRLGLLDSAAG